MALTLTRLLVPTDLGDLSTPPLRYAIALADAFGARIHLLHVMEQPVQWHLAAEMAMVMAPMEDAALRERAEIELDQLLTREEREKYRAAFAIRVGSPFAEIVEYARKEAIDLIVMGTHGRGAIAHLLIGSVAENVVRKAPCPVLTIPTRGHDFVTI